METPILTAESIILAILLQDTGITIVQLQQEPYVHKLNKMHPTTSALKAGDYQPTMNLMVLLALATAPLSRLFTAATTTMARSTLALRTATGGLLLRTIATISTTCTTAMAACIPTTTASTTGTTYGVYGLASPPRPISALKKV